MATCEHCGTGFHATDPEEKYCCRGCEYVAELIAEQGFERFYDLKRDATNMPVRSRPFEEHDFSWLAERIEAAESRAHARGGAASLDLGLEGISCVGCVWLVEKVFSRYPGGLRASANPSVGSLHIEWVPGKCDVAGYLRELCQFGYIAGPHGHGQSGREQSRLAMRLGLCGAFALNAMGFSLPSYWGMPDDFEFAGLFKLVVMLSSTLALFVGGTYFIDRAWRAARVGTLHIDLPISLGILAAYIGSFVGWLIGSKDLVYFDFVATFIFLMLGGRFLQNSAIEKNRRRMVRSQPIPESFPGESEAAPRVPRESIAPGSRFALQAGQALPVSAILASGNADFSLEWIYGEADPTGFKEGSHLPAGAILLSKSAITVEATEAWDESLISKLIAAPTHERSSPWLEKTLRIYLILVLVVGVGAFLTWGLLGHWLVGAQAMISAFVISCPCALGLALPLADDISSSMAEKLGVFIRSSSLWPRLLRVKHVIFDKTGTLTIERPILENPEAISALDEPATLALARLTRGSLHPVSRSLLEALSTRGQKLLAAHGPAVISETPGCGTSLTDGQCTWSLGKAGWTPANPQSPSQITSPATDLRRDGQLVAAFHFREALRPGANGIIQLLISRGITPHILSGDHRDKVLPLADTLGISQKNAKFSLNPTEKEQLVKSIDHQNTLYLGDGANDSLAFDAAYVTGTPVVDRSLLESKSDFYTLGSSLAYLPTLFHIARLRSHAIHASFAFAVLYNLTTITAAVLGKMDPVFAAILMPLSSIICILIIVGLMRKNAKRG